MACGGRKGEDEECCSEGLLVYILFIFNFFFWLAGAAALGIGVWTVVAKHHYLSLLTTPVFAIAIYVLIAAGAIIVIIGTIGCVGVWKKSRRYLLTYATLLLLIFIMEVVVGVLGYVFQDQLRDDLKANLNSTITTGYSVEADVTKAVDLLQQSYQCCGAEDYDDWQYSAWLKNNPDIENTVPDTCCITYSPNCGAFLPYNHPSQIFEDGCLGSIEEEVKRHAIILSSIALGFCCIQIFGIMFACCLYSKLKSDGYDTIPRK